MAKVWTLPVRKAVMAHLKADASVTMWIPAARLYPVTVPSSPLFPFGRYGAPISTPFLASGLDSSSFAASYHVFTKDIANDAGAVTMTAEDAAAYVGDAIGESLDGAKLPLGGGYFATINWTSVNSYIDGDEPGAWHAIVNFRVEVAG